MAQRETITRLRGSGHVDRLSRTSATPAEDPIPGCVVVPLMETGEQTFQGQVVSADYFVKAPGGTDLVATDKVRIRGFDCEIAGVPADYGRKGILFQARRTGTV